MVGSWSCGEGSNIEERYREEGMVDDEDQKERTHRMKQYPTSQMISGMVMRNQAVIHHLGVTAGFTTCFFGESPFALPFFASTCAMREA
jgi:hypothetical protein